MHYVVNASAMLAEGVLTPGQIEVIRKRSREAMVMLAINTLLCSGILAAALGFVFYLADAAAVAVTGALFLAIGAAILLRGGALYRMFGTASALIGAGMLSAGASFELLDKLEPDLAGLLIGCLGAIIGFAAFWALRKGAKAVAFVAGSVFLIGVAMHLAGVFIAMEAMNIGGLPAAMVMFYAAAMLVGAGIIVDVRLITALAIVPFAEMLNTSTGYFHATYAFYSREPTLSILQMTALVVLGAVIARQVTDRIGRHAGILAIMGFVVGNLCFLVGSLWGDTIGETWWRAAWLATNGDSYSGLSAAREVWQATALTISPGVYSVVWALVLAGCAAWAAMRSQRGLFNTAMVFAGIHGYTQAFEIFGDDPLAYVIGGLVAVPLAWGLWRLNARFG
jgi:uncharacterized membrane protein (Fun14 family)